MPTFEFTSPDGKTYEVQGPEGAGREEAWSVLQGQIQAGTATASEPSMTNKVGKLLNDIPRQVGLTGRAALEGVADTAQIVTEPLRYVTDRLTGMTGKTRPLGAEASLLADRIGLPKPETPLERTVQAGAKLGFGAGGLAGAAGAGARAVATPVSNAVAEVAPPLLPPGLSLTRGLAANPAQQIAGAAGAGMAGNASKEAGGGPWQQFGASLIGGVAGNFAPSTASKIADAGRNLLTRAPTPQQIDARLTATLAQAGTDIESIPAAARVAMRQEMAEAMRTGQELNPEAISRLAAFRSVGATPTRGMLSQDPVQITREQNLAKMAANSGDAEMHALPRLAQQNERALIGRLNDIGGASGVTPLQAGSVIQSRIAGTQQAMNAVERAAWDHAKAQPGYATQAIYPDALNAMNRRLGEEGLMPFMAPGVSKYMEAFQTGQQPFTAQAYRNLQSMLAGELAKGGNEAAAARVAREALEDAAKAPITQTARDMGNLPTTAATAAAMRGRDAGTQATIDAVDRARGATRAKYAWEEGSPLVETALAGRRTADPEKLANSFLLSGTLNDARQVAREVGPANLPAMKNAIATQIKEKALSGASDETGKLSQAALKRAIDSIGDEKLRLFFSPEEISQLRNASRVASLIQSQPSGSAVNNSNSGALLLGRGIDMMNRIPLIGPMVGPAVRNIQLDLGQRQATNLAPSLVRRPAPLIGANPYLLPGVAVGGALLGPKD